MPIPNYDNVTAAKLIHSFVPISRLNKGEAGKIIEEVKTQNQEAPQEASKAEEAPVKGSEASEDITAEEKVEE